MSAPQLDPDKRLRWSRRLSFVPRWSIVPINRQQNVGEHSFHVAQTARWLLPMHARGTDPNFQLWVIEWSLDHDVDEAATGDHPTPGKTRRSPTQMNQVEIVVKVADVLEAMAFMHEQISMGNFHGTHAIAEDLVQRLVPYWAAFDAYGDKLAMSDMVDAYLLNIVPTRRAPFAPHPGMEK